MRAVRRRVVWDRWIQEKITHETRRMCMNYVCLLRLLFYVTYQYVCFPPRVFFSCFCVFFRFFLSFFCTVRAAGCSYSGCVFFACTVHNIFQLLFVICFGNSKMKKEGAHRTIYLVLWYTAPTLAPSTVSKDRGFLRCFVALFSFVACFIYVPAMTIMPWESERARAIIRKHMGKGNVRSRFFFVIICTVRVFFKGVCCHFYMFIV